MDLSTVHLVVKNSCTSIEDFNFTVSVCVVVVCVCGGGGGVMYTYVLILKRVYVHYYQNILFKE